MNREDFFKKAGIASGGIYAVAALGVLVSKLQDSESFMLWRNVFLVFSASGLVATTILAIRAQHHRVQTVRQYFLAIRMTGTNLACSILCIYLSGFLIYSDSKNETIAQSIPFWFHIALAALCVHQFIRGIYRMRARWKNVADVLQSIQDIKVSIGRFSARYDFSFFTGTAILSGIAGRYFGFNMVEMLSAVIMALIFPYLLGSFVEQRAILARLLPDDMPLPKGS